MLSPRNVIELLAPARDFLCAKAAIDHGADAVYIGAPQFSARHQAANTIDDLRRVINYAHQYRCRVFVAINTILFDNEVDQARQLAHQLYDIHADALIVQDMALLQGPMPPIEIHASTQMDNRTVAKVQFLEQAGCQQVVLARELTREQIADISSHTKVRLECFIHGALCVSYSGQCYMSYCVNGRSANRGECAQPCRLAYNLLDAQGNQLAHDQHLLSLKDFNQTANLEALIDAGASTLKIEGRLKDPAYVANVTMHYRQQLDAILSRRPDLRRASSGRVVPSFTPNVHKSFNRGFTDYFFNGRQQSICQPGTPKSLGEPIGKVVEVKRDSFRISSDIQLNNGDGLFFQLPNGQFSGVNVNTVNHQWVTPRRMNGISVGTYIYRNQDIKFDALIASDKTRRLVDISISASLNAPDEVTLSITDEDGITTTFTRAMSLQQANNPASSRTNIIKQLSKLGQTIFNATVVTVSDKLADLFVPISDLNALRRDALEAHVAARLAHFLPDDFVMVPTSHPYPQSSLGRSANIVNQQAREFYEQHGAQMTEWGYERQTSTPGLTVMTTRHCIMHTLGKCLKKHPELRKSLPLVLSGANGKYQLTFDCAHCEMSVHTLA